jgi:hypothetical protein
VLFPVPSPVLVVGQGETEVVAGDHLEGTLAIRRVLEIRVMEIQEFRIVRAAVVVQAPQMVVKALLQAVLGIQRVQAVPTLEILQQGSMTSPLKLITHPSMTTTGMAL